MRLRLKLALSIASLLLGANSAMTPTSLSVGETQHALAEGTARLVGAILDYTRWPPPAGTHGAPIRLCLAGVLAHGALLGTSSSWGERAVQSAYVSATATDWVAKCDAIYIGTMDLASMRRIVGHVRGAAVLTIAEADPGCRSEAMFCLVYEPRALSFQLNIDAVSRSTLNIDPRVLRMSRGF